MVQQEKNQQGEVCDDRRQQQNNNNNNNNNNNRCFVPGFNTTMFRWYLRGGGEISRGNDNKAAASVRWLQLNNIDTFQCNCCLRASTWGQQIELCRCVCVLAFVLCHSELCLAAFKLQIFRGKYTFNTRQAMYV